MGKQKKKYLNSPIQEAICEIHFDISQPFQKDKIESLKPIWASNYPDQKLVIENTVQIQVGPDGINTKQQDQGCRLICKTFTEKKIVQLSGLFLAVNQLKPYPGWEESFRNTIKLHWDDIQKKLGPINFKRVGLRYINKIDIHESPFVWEKWFQFKLPVPELKGAETSVFQMQFRTQLYNKRRSVINVAALPYQNNISTVMLDLDMIWEDRPSNSSELHQILESVHEPLGIAFESYLTNNLREIFQKESLQR